MIFYGDKYMITFLQEKRGYKKKDVDDYISTLENDLEYIKEQYKSKNSENIQLKAQLNIYKERENIVYKTIESAVLSSQKIKEENSKILNEKIQKIEALIQKTSNFLDSLKKEYPNASTMSKNTEKIIKTISKAVNLIIKDTKEVKNTNQRKTIISSSKTGGIDNYKNLIIRNKKPSQEILTIDEIENEYIKEKNRLRNLKEVAFSIDEEPIRKFDFKEALNPTMDLEDIMKTFDLD